MNLTLTRLRFTAAGIFGKLSDESGNVIDVTLEHSFDGLPKLAVGTYTCKRGMHRLHNMTADFETFEVLGVPPFNGNPVTGLLLHWGCFNRDSEGCVLVGTIAQADMITGSRVAFAKFMALQDGFDTFILTVK
jgi:hypothetical protein